jgi:aminoglycoside phosphotransferase (APT) family kinase protein
MEFNLPSADPNPIRRAVATNRKMYAHLREWVLVILSNHALHPTRVELWQKSGVSSFIFLLHGKKKLVLKISPLPLQGEIAFFRNTAKVGVPVPRFLVSDVSKELIPCMYYIADWIEGTLLPELPKDNIHNAAKEVGRKFTILHSVRVKGFGMPALKGAWPDKSWVSVLRNTFFYNSIKSSTVKTVLGPTGQRTFESIFRDKNMHVTQPSLVHSDPNEDQFLCAPKTGRLKAILDPGHFIGGDPMFDLAYSQISWNSAEFRKGFYTGYTSAHLLSKQEMYRYERLQFITQLFAACFLYERNRVDSKPFILEAKAIGKKLGIL